MSSKKDEDEIKIEDLFSLLDKCITSDKENVKKALRELLVIVALSAPADVKDGPLTKMLEKIGKMEKRINSLEKELSHRNSTLTEDQLEMMRRLMQPSDIKYNNTWGTYQKGPTDPWTKLRDRYDPNF